MTSDVPLSFSDQASPTNVTLPEENLCHYIRHDELRRLGEMRKDLVMEACLAAFGVFFGALVPALTGLNRFLNAPVDLSGSDLLSMILCFGALGVGAVTAFQWYVRHRGHTDLVTEIQNRPKVPVRLLDAANQ